MAMSSAEKQRRYRERQKQKKSLDRNSPQSDDLAPYLGKTFSEFMQGQKVELYENLDAFGVIVTGTGFDDEQQEFETQHAREEPLTSLQRTEGLIDALIDAARELATAVNEYKLEEIDRQMRTASPATKVKLEYLRKPLTKRTSQFFPVTRVEED